MYRYQLFHTIKQAFRGKRNFVVSTPPVKGHRSLSDWVFQRNTGTYERPFTSSEAVYGTLLHYFDGTGAYSCGTTFKVHRISQDAVVTSIREAIGRMRFFAPIVACNRKVHQAQPLQQSFVYKPALNAEEVQAWAEASLTIEKANGRTLKECLAQQAEKSFPYVHPNGHEQYLNFFLIRHEKEDVYSLSFRVSHGFVDGRPSIQLFLRTILDTIASPNKNQQIQQLEWGTECKNLPDSPATLARRNLDLQSSRDNNGVIWEKGWRELKQRIEKAFNRKELGESLKPSRPEPTGKGPITRVSHYVDAASLDSIKSELKKSGLTMALLVQAAHMLTVLQRSQPLKPESYVTLDLTMIDTSRFFPPGQLIASSRTGFVPIIIEAKNIDWNASTRHQLISMMKSLDNQIKDYLRYPQLTLIDTVGPTKPDVAPMHPHTCIISYVGPIDIMLPPTIMDESGEVALEIIDFDITHRHAGGFQRPSHIYWSFRGKLTIMLQSLTQSLIQACDNWNSNLFEQALKEIADNMLRFVSDKEESIKQIS